MTNLRPVILGLGNPLFQDEGLGIHVIHQLMQENISEQVELIDGGTDALSLLGTVEDAQHLLIVDAINGNFPPGTIKQLEGQDIPLLLSAKLSPHQIGFQEVLALARLRGRSPEHLTLIGVQPQSMDWGTELTPCAANSLPRVVEMIYEQIKIWESAYSLVPKHSDMVLFP